MHNILYKTWKRNTLWLFFLFLFLIIGFSIGQASANEPERQTEWLGQKGEQYIIARPATTTTTAPKPLLGEAPSSVAEVATRDNPNPVSSVPETTGPWVAQCVEWMHQAGYEEWEIPYALYIIDRESDCNPTVKNPSSSAYGIPQALNKKECPEPGGKMCMMGEGWQTNPVLQLQWMKIYITDPRGNHGSWQKAYSAKISGGTY